ncbi:MAG: hypothetical protein PWR31_815 [Bacillota bacterium]|nr:hypothetical protein [Bacillota bacterium]
MRRAGLVTAAATVIVSILLAGALPVGASPAAALQPGSRGEGVRVLQELLSAQALFAVTPDGVYGPVTEQAVRSFQAGHGLPVDGVVGPDTWAALLRVRYAVQPGDTLPALAARFATTVEALTAANPGLQERGLVAGEKLRLPPLALRSAPTPDRGQAAGTGSGRLVRWEEAARAFRDGTTATVTDVETGLTFRVRRRGGHYHADVEPATAEDTQKLRKIYGRWSWERRAVLVDYGAGPVAASINGMPHGSGDLSGNNFPGHICLHFLGSRTHGSAKVDPEHQAMVYKAAGKNK